MEKKDKRRFVLLIVGITFTSIWNIGGIASIMPLIEVLTSPSGEVSDSTIAEILNLFGVGINEDSVIWLGLGVLFLFVTGNGFLALVTWRSIDFARTVAFSLSTRLFDTYLRQEYAFYLNHNTSELMKNIFGELNNIVSGVLKPAVEFLVEAVLALGIIVFLVIIDPVIALFAALLLGGGYGAIFLLFRVVLNKASRAKVKRNREKYGIVADAFGAIKEVKLMGLERRYSILYQRSAYRLERAKVRIQAVAKLPRFALETLAFGGILTLALVIYATGRSAASVLPLLSAYVFAGYKLLPALQRIFAAMANIRGSHASVQLVVHELHRSAPELPELPAESAIRLNQRITLEKITFSYGGAALPALRDISVTIEKNTTFGIAGPTGCGKTTLVDLILGLHYPQSGRLLIDETVLAKDNLRDWRRHIGYVPQVIYLSDTSVTKNIAFGVDDQEIDHARVRFAAQLANLDEFVSSMEEGYETQLGERGVRLSGGQRQRVGIARALYTDPDVLVFDEATSALDTQTEQAVMEAISKLMHKKTILIIAHRLSTLTEADKILVLKDGNVDAVGTYESLIASHPHFSQP